MDQNEKQQFAEADAVLLVKVLDTKLLTDFQFERGLTEHSWRPDRDDQFEIVEAKFRIVETFKSPNKTISVIRSRPPAYGSCSVDLLSGVYYLVFLSGEHFVGTCSGSKALNVQAREPINKILSQLRQRAKSTGGRGQQEAGVRPQKYRQDLTLTTSTSVVPARSAAPFEATRSEPCSLEPPSAWARRVKGRGQKAGVRSQKYRQDLTLRATTCEVHARSAAPFEATRSEPCSSESPFCMGEARRI